MAEVGADSPGLKILVVDGMGGSIGSQIVARLRQVMPEDTEIVVLGTNAIAAASMMKAGANRGASGENAFKVTAPEADIIVGPVGVMMPDSFMGELTSAMAGYLSSARARKVLLPITQPQIEMVGVSGLPLPHLMDEMVKTIRRIAGLKEVKEIV